MRLAALVFYGAALAVLTGACASKPAARTAQDSPSPVVAAEATEGAGDEDGESAGDGSETSDVESSEPAGPCPADMALVEIATATATATPRRFCVDKYEASLVEVLADGTERPYAHYLPVDGHDVRAVSRPHVFPQGYISEVQAQDACSASGKHLCNHEEWKTACMGPSHTTFPYGDGRRAGACHDTGKSAVIAVFGAKAVAASTPYSAPAPAAATATDRNGKPVKRAHLTKRRAAQVTRPRGGAGGAASSASGGGAAGAASAAKTTPKHAPGKTIAKKGTHNPAKKSARPASVDPGVWAKLNDPGLAQVDGALARTGEHPECVNGFGVFDMVGNLHEWVATDPAALHGTFAGGYYLDTTLNGDGCLYKTQAHAHDYHDYSTGFRCCGSAQQ